MEDLLNRSSVVSNAIKSTDEPLCIEMTLPFQRQILQDIHAEDGLVIIGRGLGIMSIVGSLLKGYSSHPNSLILVLGCSFDEAELFSDIINRDTDGSSHSDGKASESCSIKSESSANSSKTSRNNDATSNLDESSNVDTNLNTKAMSNLDASLSNAKSKLKASSTGSSDVQRSKFIYITTDSMSVSKRQEKFASGGIFAVTSRIVVTDMLTGIVPVNKITGIVLLHAETVTASSTEAFILRIYRERNRDGFIKAFSSAPELFTIGFSPLEKMMKNLFLRNIYLWPRFHLLVKKSLERTQIDAVEFRISISPKMKEIQDGLLECIEATLGEIKRLNRSVIDWGDEDEWSTEDALQKQFDIIIRRRLDPVWHRISPKTRQLVSDLTVQRNLLNFLVSYDCVSFLMVIDIIIAANSDANGPRLNISPWVYLDAAQRVFDAARSRVYVKITAPERTKDDSSGKKPKYTNILEEQPKWEALHRAIFEIQIKLNEGFAESFESGTCSLTKTILIMCSDIRTCRQVRNVLIRGRRDSQHEPKDENCHDLSKWMLDLLYDYFRWKEDFSRFNSSRQTNTEQRAKPEPSTIVRGKPPNKRRRVRGSAKVMGSFRGFSEREDLLDIHPQLRSITEDEIGEQDYANKTSDNLNKSESLHSGSISTEKELIAHSKDDGKIHLDGLDADIVILPYRGEQDDRVLLSLRPLFIILYDSEPSFVRRIECFVNEMDSKIEPTIYNFNYTDTVEEQVYLATIRREKDSFSRLVREKANMAVVLDAIRDKDDSSPDKFLRSINTRIAGGGHQIATAERPRVVIDIREFRSSLPSLLHAKDITVIPSQILIGDYILSPTMCVERKSVRDLVQSLNSGRLFNQCENMAAYYEHPILLIEFDEGKLFALGSTNDPKLVDPNDLQSKLVLLSLSFPKLKIIWSSSPNQSAEIFAELKKLEKEPDVEKSVNMGVQPGRDPSSALDEVATDFVKALPMINSHNYLNIVYSEIKNVRQLVNSDKEKITQLIGPKAAIELYNFINHDMKNQTTTSG